MDNKPFWERSTYHKLAIVTGVSGILGGFAEVTGLIDRFIEKHNSAIGTRPPGDSNTHSLWEADSVPTHELTYRVLKNRPGNFLTLKCKYANGTEETTISQMPVNTGQLVTFKVCAPDYSTVKITAYYSQDPGSAQILTEQEVALLPNGN